MTFIVLLIWVSFIYSISGSRAHVLTNTRAITFHKKRFSVTINSIPYHMIHHIKQVGNSLQIFKRMSKEESSPKPIPEVEFRKISKENITIIDTTIKTRTDSILIEQLYSSTYTQQPSGLHWMMWKNSFKDLIHNSLESDIDVEDQREIVLWTYKPPAWKIWLQFAYIYFPIASFFGTCFISFILPAFDITLSFVLIVIFSGYILILFCFNGIQVGYALTTKGIIILSTGLNIHGNIFLSGQPITEESSVIHITEGCLNHAIKIKYSLLYPLTPVCTSKIVQDF